MTRLRGFTQVLAVTVSLAGGSLARAQNLHGDEALSKILLPEEGWQRVAVALGPLRRACADAAGNLYLGDSQKGGIRKLAPDGQLTVWWADLRKVARLACDVEGKVYALVGKQILLLSRDGKSARPWGNGAPGGDLAVNGKGIVFASDSRNGRLMILPGPGTWHAGPMGMAAPGGLALTPDGGTLVAAESGGRHVWAFRVEASGELTAGSPWMELRLPAGKQASGSEGVTVDGEGRIYIASPVGTQMFDWTGRMGGVIANPSASTPTAVAFAGEGRAYLYLCAGDQLFRRKTRTQGNPMASAPTAAAAFLGRWDITPLEPRGNYAYWLSVTSLDGGGLRGNFLNGGGSVLPLARIEVQKDELLFWLDGKTEPYGRARIVEGKLLGGFLLAGGKTQTWQGVHPPNWKAADANAQFVFGKPVVLFDGTNLDGWTVQFPDRPMKWSVVAAAMTNDQGANNLVSRATFQDFKIELEYKLEAKSNSGVYLRGRYELQINDAMGAPVEAHQHGALYSRVPPRVNASKPAGEWQRMEAVIVENRLSATLNGQRIHDNTVIEGITGGAFSADEGAPGPIMLQGDHSKVWFRKVVVTPIVK